SPGGRRPFRNASSASGSLCGTVDRLGGRDRAPQRRGRTVRGPAGVMALVLAETAAGGAGFLFLTPLWREVRPGFFYLTGITVLVVAVSTAGAANAALDPNAGSGGSTAIALSLALAGATLVWMALMRLRLRRVGRVL